MKQSASRKGNQTPTFSRVTPYAKTQGEMATRLFSSYDLTLHPWQEQILNDWLAIDDKGKLINSYCILEVPRQNGKTGVSDPRETWGLIVRGESILHTAQEFQTAKKAFDRLRKKFGSRKNDPYCDYPELNALVDHYTTSAGQMVLDLTNGGHIEFRTRGNSSDMGRGGTFDLVVVDEAQAYTDEQDAALSPLNSAAPTGSPQTILMGTPPTGRTDKGTVFRRGIESMKKSLTEGMCIHLWGVDSIVDPQDKDWWYRCNPSLGYQLLESAIAKDAASMSPDTFNVEHLGYIAKTEEVTIEHAIKAANWRRCSSDLPKPEGKTAYGIKFDADGSAVCLCGAVIPSVGKPRISLIEFQSTNRGIRWLSEWLNQRSKTACCVVIDGRNGVDVLIDQIQDSWKFKDSIKRASTRDMISAVGCLTDAINEGNLTWYSKQTALDESARTVTKRKIGGGWGFGGDNSLPIEACALALWGAQNTKRDPNRKMRIG